MNIYVGNLSPETSESQLREKFGQYGEVGKISMDRQPRSTKTYGFCFIEMPFDSQAAVAIRELNGKKLAGHALTIRESGLPI